MHSDPVHQYLVNARNYLDKHGWVQGRARSVSGRVCAYGAIFWANDKGLNICRDTAAREELVRAEDINKTRFKHPVPVPIYNDKYISSKEECLDWFDRAIANTAPDPENIELKETEEHEPVCV